VNAYVLIGGRSSRMGASKTVLFLERIVAAASPVFDEVIAVQRHDSDAASIRTIFETNHEDEAPIFGIETALRDAQGDVFILAVDYPLLTSSILQFIRDARGVPEWNGRVQTLCAVWPRDMLPRIEERILERRYDLHTLVEQEKIIAEDVLRARFPGEPLANVNTPEELEKAEKHG
jgi:molybdopterin-guanine dinucleotide biosynthesis protein A